MRKIIEELQYIWLEATYPRKFQFGKYLLIIKPFHIVIKRNEKGLEKK